MSDPTTLKAGERRTAAILFADMKGFTSLSERMDPEEMDALMGRLFGTFEDLIRAHGGTVEKYIGDALVAVFGVPELHDDDPRRALEAALAFLERRKDSQADGLVGSDAAFRIGIHMGLLATGTRGEFDVVTGHAMAVAQRLQAAAEPGGILVSDAVKRQCESDFEFSGPRSIEAKGKTTGIEAWTVIGPRSSSAQDRGPFVGRKDLLDELLGLYLRSDPSALHGRYIVGEAGMGKTRLAFALMERMRAFPDFQAPVLSARAQKYRPGTYAVVADLILERLGLDQASGADGIASALDRIPGMDGQHARKTAELIAGAGMGDQDPGVVLSLVSVFSAVMRSGGSAIYSPFVFIDDAPAMDRQSREFLQYYLRQGGVKPFLLMAGRDHPQQLREAFPELKAQRLGPLDKADAESLARSHWQDCPDALMGSILAQSMGNPLFVREYALFAKQHRTLSSLPSTIQNMFLTSLDRYDPEYRDFIKMMSPFVLNFQEDDARRVLAGAGGNPDLAGPALELFARDGVLLRNGERYAFAVDMFKKALYESLLNHNKRLIHGVIADIMLERKSPNRLRLMRHLLGAERWGQASSVMLRDPARNYCYEYLEFIEPLYRRLSREAPDESVQLLILRSAILFNAGKIDEAEQELKRVMKVALSRRNDSFLGFAYHMVCAHATMTYAFQKAHFTGQKALYYYRLAGMGARSVQNVVRTIAQVEFQRNNFEEARALIDQMALLPDRDEFEYASASAEFHLYSGDYTRALAALDSAPQAQDDDYGAVARFFGLDLRLKVLWQLCDFKALGEAASQLLSSGSLSESALAQAHAMSACASSVAGDDTAARESFLQSDFWTGQVHNDYDRVDALRTAALCLMVAGRRDRAEELAQEAVVLGLRHSCYYPTFTVLMILVDIEYAKGRKADAAFFLREASYFFTTGLLLPYKDVILYYYYASLLLEGELAAKAPAIALKLIEDEKARIGEPGLVNNFLVARGFGDVEKRLAGAINAREGAQG
ncbi:MAG: hypothetical protein KBB32_05090 [Spirochaetia bacterium]|nr:hypothetical protein [Spirochaetia bacterium]